MKGRISGIIVHIIIIISLLISLSCRSKKEATNVPAESKQEVRANPPVIIYKTRKDYFDKVPISLSNDKMSVVSFPDKTDIYYRGSFASPTLLVGGYLLDNRGIGKNSAFTDYSYSEYSQLEATPTAETLIKRVIDNDPFIEIYSCKCKRDTIEINRLIKKGIVKNCLKIK